MSGLNRHATRNACRTAVAADDSRQERGLPSHLNVVIAAESAKDVDTETFYETVKICRNNWHTALITTMIVKSVDGVIIEPPVKRILSIK